MEFSLVCSMGRFMKLAYFKCYDHSSAKDMGWCGIDQLCDESVIIEVSGFIEKEDESAYYLVMARGDDEFSGAFTVIKSTIIKKKFFKVP